MIPLFKVAMSHTAPAEVSRVLASGYVGQGPKVEEFERALSARIGNQRVVTVNSATSGLHLALHLTAAAHAQAAGKHYGDLVDPERSANPGEVLTTPLTMEATNWTALANGFRIRWVDVDPDTLNMDFEDLARKISPLTRAILVVHFAGYPADLERLRAITDAAADRLGFRPAVIEDCAQAWGATYRGSVLGNHGNTAVFSFQAIKHLTCADGGLVVSPEDELDRRARLLRWFGIDRGSTRLRGEYDVAEWGFKFHMNDVNAAIGLANLETAEDALHRHRENAAYFDAELAGVAGLELTERAADREPSFWVYPVKVDDREGFVRHMEDAGIMVSQVHRRNDAHSCVREYAVPLSGLDSAIERFVCVPVGWWLSADDREYIVRTIKAGW